VSKQAYLESVQNHPVALKMDGFGAGKWDVATIATQVTGQFELI